MKNKLRNEFFGALIYIPKIKNYIYGDFLTKDIILNSEKLGDYEYRKKLKEKYDTNDLELDDIIKQLQRYNLTSSNTEVVNTSYPADYLSAPLRIFLDFTYKCNLRCKHCFTNSGSKRNNELSLAEKKNIIDQMVEMGTYRISLAGGEPLFSEDFIPFVEYARSKDIEVSFTTNGTLFNNEIIDKLNSLKIKTVTVSLEGPDKNTNDLIRGDGQFEKVVNNIKLLRKKYEGKIALRMTLMKTNIDKLSEFVSLAESLDCNTVKFNCIRFTGRARNNMNLILTPSEYIETIKHGASLKSSKVSITLPLNPYTQCSYDYIKTLGFGCVAGKDCMTVFPDGQVKPCSQLDESYVDGNVKEISLTEIWNKGKNFNFFRNLEGNETCKNCTVYDKCRGGCRYRCLIEGDVNQVDPYCYLNKGRI